MSSSSKVPLREVALCACSMCAADSRLNYVSDAEAAVWLLSAWFSGLQSMQSAMIVIAHEINIATAFTLFCWIHLVDSCLWRQHQFKCNAGGGNAATMRARLDWEIKLLASSSKRDQKECSCHTSAGAAELLSTLLQLVPDFVLSSLFCLSSYIIRHD